MVLKIFFIDRFVTYSVNTFKSLQKLVSKENKIQITFVGPDEKNAHWLSYHSVDNSVKVWSYGNYLRRLHNYIKKSKPNIVHFSFELRTYGPLLTVIKFPVLLLLIKLTNTKIIVSLHNIMIFKENGKWKILQDVPLKIPRFMLKIMIRVFVRLICALSDKIIVGTRISKLGLVEFFGINKEKIEIIPLGIGTEDLTKNENLEYEFRKKFKGKKILLCFGNISPRKGQEIVIKAFKRFAEKIPDYMLVIAGRSTSGFESYEKKLHQLVKKLSLENRIFFTGFVSDEEIEVLFKMCEIAIFVYKPMPGTSHALTFAIKHNKPVIVSNIDVFKEILGNVGLFVEPDNETQLSDVMEKAITDKNSIYEFQQQMKNIAKNFSWDISAKNHLRVYNEVVS